MSSVASSQSVSTSIGASMVASNSGLSLFDKPLDRENRDVVCGYLSDLSYKIVAVWLVARPISGISNGCTYEHWCVKIQAPPCLISIDFLESHGKGKFALSVTTAMEAELSEFLMYYVNTKEERLAMKWRIIASVTPSPLINNKYKPNYLDPHELSTLKKYTKAVRKQSKKTHSQQSKVQKPIYNEVVLQKIKCRKRVCDIADFLEMWTEFEVKNKKQDKPYNPVSHNCQQFALHLFKYLVGNNYPQKVENATKQTQSPADIQARKKKSKNKASATHQVDEKEDDYTTNRKSNSPLIEVQELQNDDT
eukprot:294245_1